MTDLITPADLKAAEDVLDQLIEQTEDMDVARASEMKAACDRLAKKANLAKDMCNMAGVKAMDGQPVREVGQSTFSVATAEKWVTDHPRLRLRLIQAILFNRDSGARRRISVEDAVTETVDAMVDLFVAPSDVPKAAGLKKLRISKADVCENVGGKKTLIEGIKP